MITASSEFTVRVDSAPDGFVLRLSGELDIGTVDSLHGAVRQLEQQLSGPSAAASPSVVLDLRTLDFIDSTGLRALIEAKENVEGRGAALRLVRGPEAVMKVFRITKLDERFEILDSLPN